MHLARSQTTQTRFYCIVLFIDKAQLYFEHIVGRIVHVRNHQTAGNIDMAGPVSEDSGDSFPGLRNALSMTNLKMDRVSWECNEVPK